MQSRFLPSLRADGNSAQIISLRTEFSPVAFFGTVFCTGFTQSPRTQFTVGSGTLYYRSSRTRLQSATGTALNSRLSPSAMDLSTHARLVEPLAGVSVAPLRNECQSSIVRGHSRWPVQFSIVEGSQNRIRHSRMCTYALPIVVSIPSTSTTTYA